MSLLKSLKFVQGAVAKKNHVPVLKHFKIANSRIESCNGVLSLSSPIDCNLETQPHAETFVHAVEVCDDITTLHETATGRLAITSGKFKAYINTSTSIFPDARIEGERIEVEGLLEAIATLRPMIGDDASRPWSHGILFLNNSAYATNNIVLVEHWLPRAVSRPFGLPSMTVNELLRINEEPESVQISERIVTFHFSGERWLSSKLLEIASWPDVRELLKMPGDAELYPLDDSFFETLLKLRPFTNDLRPVWLDGNTISTASADDDGARIQTTECENMKGTWTLDQLSKLKGTATQIAWDNYPKPCPFFGDGLRGVIIGIKA
jgi:DNA polymerase III sliding clamp (beta) subunit (PCNA family)